MCAEACPQLRLRNDCNILFLLAGRHSVHPLAKLFCFTLIMTISATFQQRFTTTKLLRAPPLLSVPCFLYRFAPRVIRISQQTGLNALVCTSGGLGSVVSVAESVLITILMGTLRIQNTGEPFIPGVANDSEKKRMQPGG